MHQTKYIGRWQFLTYMENVWNCVPICHVIRQIGRLKTHTHHAGDLDANGMQNYNDDDDDEVAQS